MHLWLLLAIVAAALALSWAVPLVAAGDWRGEVVWPLSEEPGYKSYPRRWHTLAIFVAQTFVNAFLWISFAPIVELTQSYYGVSVTAVNMLSVVYMVLYAPGSYIAMHFITTSGLRRTIVLGVLLNATGSLVRLASIWGVASGASNVGYAILLVGQALPALAQPLFTNVPAKLAGDWFPDSQRDVATVIGALGNVLGNAAGQVIPTLLVTCSAEATAASSESGSGSQLSYAGRQPLMQTDVNTAPRGHGICSSANDVTGMGTLLFLQAALASLFALWALFFFDGIPPSPPSRSAAQRLEDSALERTRESFSASVTIRKHTVLLLANAEFRKLLVGFGIGLAVFNALLTVLGQLILPLYLAVPGEDSHNRQQQLAALNAATSDAGLYGGLLIGSGLIGASVVGPVLDSTHAYRTALKGGFVCATVSLAYVLSQLKPNNQTHIAIGFGVMGFAMMPLLPVALEAAVEATYPLPEEMSATLLMLVGNIGGLAFTYLLQYLISLESIYNAHRGPFSTAAWFLLGSVGFSMIIVASFNGKYLRLDAERETAGPAERGVGLQERLSSTSMTNRDNTNSK